MKRRIALLAALALAAGTAGKAQEAEPAKQSVTVKLAILLGDPLGSRAAGNVQVLVEPVIVNGKHIMFQRGGWDELIDATGAKRLMSTGQFVEGTLRLLDDGKVKLNLQGKYYIAREPRTEPPQIDTLETRTSGTYKLGEVIRMRLGKGTAEQQTWVELTLESGAPN